MTEQEAKPDILQHFVLKEPRLKQIAAVEYVQCKYEEGFRHIVIAAPTGAGKSCIGATACFWSAVLNEIDRERYDSGGYYLVAQKLLQDQLANDFKDYVIEEPTTRCQSIKSSFEYTCEKHGTCAYGMSRKEKCGLIRNGACRYIRQRNLWGRATLSVTNYAYLFTEHQLVGRLKPRRMLILDECHGLESQILRFVELSITQEGLRKWTPTIKQVPDFEDVREFAEFLADTYLPVLKKRLEMWEGWEPIDESPEERRKAQEKLDLENHWGRTLRGVYSILDEPDNWIFYQEENKKKELEAMAKPLDAGPFSQDLIFEMGHVCIHMSAYPGSKKVYCDSLGLDPEEVAWLNLNSTFPIENREIYMTLIGSMSKRNRADTLPRLLDFLLQLMKSYPDKKGIIHCNSYELGGAIYDALKRTDQGFRLIYPTCSDDREACFAQHKRAVIGSVILSPSMTEGFDFAYDLARWQAIAKISFPYLLDRQIEAKKERNPDWYDLQAVKSIIQATGRIVRGDTDEGHTYILDSDFMQLWDRQRDMFPKWWTDAVVWPKR